MIVPWTPQPSPDGVKPPSWRIRLLVRLGPVSGRAHTAFFQATFDTGSLWTTFTDDFARAAGITDITLGRPTTVRWFGMDHAAWQHRIRLSIALDPNTQDSITEQPFDMLFIRRFPHPNTGRLVSLAVLGMDCISRLRLNLDGPAAVTRF